MTEPALLVSVIIPVFNGASFLSGAVENIRNQGYQLIEVIIVDDGSTDETAKVAADLNDTVRYVYQSNQGPAVARNKGLEIARGSIIGFLDVDDRWPEKSLITMVDYMEKSADTEVVMGKIQLCRVREDKTEELSEPFIAFNIGCALFRKEVFAKVGIFDPMLRYGEDVDWFMRAREHAVSIVVLEQVTLLYRLHQSNMTRGKNPVALNVVKVLKRSLDRRRDQNAGIVQSLPNIPQPIRVEDFCPTKPNNSE